MNDRQHRLLVVDDDSRLRDLLVRYLGEQGFEVKAVGDAAQMDKLRTREHFDLIVLDLMLPGEDGLSICRRLRGTGDTTPIIMLTAKGEEVDRIVGLEMGADDYLPKPFNPRELVARIHAVLRRQTTTPPPARRKSDEGGPLRQCRGRSRDPRPQARRRTAGPDHRRIRRAQGAAAAPAPAACPATS